MLIRNGEIEASEFLELITGKQITVYEDIQGSKIYVNYVNGNWQIRPKSVKNDPINLVDLAVQKYYKWAYIYLLSLPSEVTDLLRPNYFYCFEYFPDEQPAHIKYDRMPKNGLILTGICKYGKQFISDFTEIKTWAELFDVETLPVIYKGILGDKQLLAINYFLNTSERDLSLFFKETNFATFFYKMLNPFLDNSYLKNSGFNSNLEKIIIRFNGGQEEMTLEILNPMYQKMALKNDTEFSDVYSILLFNFMQWLLAVDLESIDLDGTTRDLVYINLICELYNRYIDKYQNSINDFIFVVPKFFNTDKFKINRDIIKNKKTVALIDSNDKFEYIFKIILSNFQKLKTKEIGIINKTALNHLNDLILKIQQRCDSYFNFTDTLNNYSLKMKDMSEYPDIKWEEDNKGYVTYPEIGDAFDDQKVQKKKLGVQKKP